MAFQSRNTNESISLNESNRLPIRSFGREIQNIPDPRFGQQQSQTSQPQQRSQSIKSGSFENNQNNYAEQENGGAKRNSPRKFSLHVKPTTSSMNNSENTAPNNFSKRFSSQIEGGASQQYQLQQQQQLQTGAPAVQSTMQQKPVNLREVEDELNAISRQDSVKPTLISQYSRQIFDYLRTREGSFKVSGYMEKQMHISERMRAILVDWLVDAHKKFRLLPETLFMTVNIIDRYLDIATCTREKLQLVGVTALFIAAKYEEIYPPPLKDFSELTSKAYSKAEILQMEGNIVLALKFNLTVPSSLRFLERYSRVEKLDKRSFDMAQYLLELSLVEFKFVKASESLKACAAIYLTNKLFKKPNCWTNTTAVHSQHSEQSIRACALDLCMMLQTVPQSPTQAVHKKFLAPAFSQVATIQIERINNSNNVPNNNSNNQATSNSNNNNAAAAPNYGQRSQQYNY